MCLLHGYGNNNVCACENHEHGSDKNKKRGGMYPPPLLFFEISINMRHGALLCREAYL